ncbi:hypothetical protein [Rhizobium phage RHEph12]|nr:hypothetical protein [Rhizobium phage RHEph12]
MTIQSRIAAGFSSVATGVRSLHSLISGSNTGDLSALTTVSKSSLLAALNEIKAGQNLGFEYSFSMASQPRVTWIQATPLTQAFNTAGSQVTQSGGAFTFAAGSVANVARNWLFYLEAYTTTQEAADIAVELRVGGVSVARQVAGRTTGASSNQLYARPHLSVPYRITGGQVITFHVMHNYTPLVGASTVTLAGKVGAVAL